MDEREEEEKETWKGEGKLGKWCGEGGWKGREGGRENGAREAEGSDGPGEGEVGGKMAGRT